MLRGHNYVTFCANFAWTLILLILSRLHSGDTPCSAVIWLLAITTVILLRASHVQWTYFVNYLNKVLEEGEIMLKNDPPPGTKVRFAGELRESRGSAVGALLRPLRKYFVDRSEDEFEVQFGGERITVQRREIEEA